MEGRVLPRPNCRCAGISQRRKGGFNGGSGITPTELEERKTELRDFLASMEGRVLPRPNKSMPRETTPHNERFNGGSGITPTE